MFDLKQFGSAIQQIAEEKGIAVEKVIETIEMALAAAYKKDYGKKGQIIRASFNPKTGDAAMKQIKIVVDETMLKSDEEIQAEEEERAKRLEEGVRRAHGERHMDEDSEDFAADGERKVRYNPEKHLMADEAKKLKPGAKPGDELEFPLEFHEDFGRIAAQTAKQVIIQRIREAEREAIYDEYKDREGELISGLIQRIEGRNIFIDIGRTTALLPPEEQVFGERYNLGERIKILIIAVERNSRGPGIIVSRSHPRLVRKLFEIEVPEIPAGSVEIKIIAREAGSRSKVAVASHQENIDPVGSLVGQKGVRVSTVIHELAGEKIDIIEWSDDPASFIAHALSPAKVIDAEINAETRTAKVIVPDSQLSLAIGRGGQNVRLAAKLTGWKIDVHSDTPEAAEPESAEASAEEESPRAPDAPIPGAFAKEAEQAETAAESPDEEKLAEAKETTEKKMKTKRKAAKKSKTSG